MRVIFVDVLMFVSDLFAGGDWRGQLREILLRAHSRTNSLSFLRASAWLSGESTSGSSIVGNSVLPVVAVMVCGIVVLRLGSGQRSSR